MKFHVKFVFLVCAWLASTLNIVAQSDPAWTLVWSDEFAQPDGSAPDSSKWGYNTGGGGWGNGELETYTTTNAWIQGGELVIEASRVVSRTATNFYSARMLTQGKWSWTYGRMEARIKIPHGQGIWPAFWMLGTNIDGVNWPTCGEIDIMENIGKEPTQVHGTVHGPGYSGGSGVGQSYSLPGNAAFADDFHVYAVEWTTNQIKWFVDSVPYFSVAPASVPGAWVFTQPQFLLLNVAVGGQWPGNPDATTTFPQRMLVDYVRVYAISNPPPTSSGALINGNFETGSLGPWVGKNFCCANPGGGNIFDTNGLVWDPALNAANNQGIKNPAFGRYSCKVYGNFNGSPNSPGFYQDVNALPGSVWKATIKARTQYTDNIRTANQAVVEVSFLNAVDGVLAKFASPVFNTSTPINTWVSLDVTNQIFPVAQSSSQIRAPAGTVKLRFEVTFSQTLYDLGSIYFDDAVLREIVSPALNASIVGGNILISFPTQQGVNYQVLFKNQLSDLDWNPIETIPGDGNAKSVSYPANAPFRFYLVKTL